MNAVGASVQGDDICVDVRLVVAPTAGIFRPARPVDVTTEGEVVAAGAVLGYITGAGTERAVTSFCTGFLIRVLAHPGERVRPGQPIAWLHPVDRPATRPVASGAS